MEIVLYYAPITCALAPYITLTEAGAKFEVRPLNFRKGQQNSPEYLPRLQQDILKVIRRYAKVADDAVDIQVERANGYEVLELNVTLPDEGVHLPPPPLRRRRRKANRASASE